MLPTPEEFENALQNLVATGLIIETEEGFSLSEEVPES